ncbi:MAG: DNA-processing protein DprA [Opitutaceae bacterium]|nr:DNA-processing protein DprA [Opitutaceae bacterium]
MSDALSQFQAFLILNALPDVGPVTTNRLLAEFAGDPCRILSAGGERLQEVRGVGEVISRSIVSWKEVFDLEKEEARMAASGVGFLTTSDVLYPPLLKEIHDPPIGLYRKGNPVTDRPCVAIVGSRRTTAYGQTVAAKLGADLARAGFCVVSGLARGIDTAAHEGALCAGGQTAAILGHGMDTVYPPENLALYRRIEREGVILTEFPFTRRADRQSFAMRNRIVAGMSVALIVVESDVNGGSMITAKFAGDQGRLVFAVPGRIDQPTSAGCHQLIRDGATLLTSVDDLLSELSYLDGLRPAAVMPNASRHAVPSAPEEVSPEEQRLLSCFAGGAILSIDALCDSSGLALPEVSAGLMQLELRRRVVKRVDGTFEARAVL